MRMNKADVNQIGAVVADVSNRVAIPKYKKLLPDEISEKARNDYVTSVDFEIQNDLINVLEEHYPESIFISEEMPQQYSAEDIKELSKSQHVWIIDPLDGTANFIEGNPNFRTAVALIKNGVPVASWIHSPLDNETLCALSGRGAWELRAGQEINVSQNNPRTVEVLDVNSNVKEIFNDEYKLKNLYSRSATYGAMAQGKIDGAVFTKELLWWDHIPGTLLHREAGGVNGMINGEQYDLQTTSRNLLSANSPTMWRDLQRRARPYLIVPESIESGLQLDRALTQKEY